MNEIYEYVSSLCKRAKKASGALAVSGVEVRNSALYNMADLILKSKSDIIEANKLDLKNAASNGVSAPMLDRLSLDGKRIDSIATAINKTTKPPNNKTTKQQDNKTTKQHILLHHHLAEPILEDA